MRRKRTLRLAFTLLLALLLPIEGFAALPRCVAEMPSLTQHHCPTTPALHHHDCGCSCAAVVITGTMPPLAPPPPAVARWYTSTLAPPLVELDRLDRPPRSRHA